MRTVSNDQNVTFFFLLPTAESSDDTDQDGQCEEHKRRRRRRGKKRHAPHEHSSIDGETGAGEPKDRHLTQDSNVSEGGDDDGGGGGGGGEPLSKNRRRKLKKKRHKEKLHSLGLVPRASALEFTYQKEGEEEVEGKSVDEVSRFLRSTMEIYLSDGECLVAL